MCSSDLSELAELCDSVTIIDRGKVKYSGSMHGLLLTSGEHPAYRLTVAGESDWTEPLSQLTGVLKVEPIEGRPEYRIEFDEAQLNTNQLLQGIIGLNIPIMAFAEDKRHLNEAFMDLTERGVK